MSLPVLLVIYIISTISLWIYVRQLSISALTWGRRMLLLGLFLHGAFLLSHFVAQGRFVPSNPEESTMLTTFITALAAWTFCLRRQTVSVTVVLLPVVLVVFTFLKLYVPATSSSAWPSPWLWMHVLLMIVGEAVFFVAAGLSIVFLAAESQIRRKSFSGWLSGISSLSDFDARLSNCLGLGFVFLSLGMVMGFFFAKSFWSAGWWSDPKVLFCVVTWVLYGSLIVARQIFPSVRGRRSAWISFLGFLGVLFLSWGVEYLFESRHVSYEIESGAKP